MRVNELGDVARLRECVQELSIQVARLSQAIEPLVRIQQEQDVLRDRVASLEGFKAAVLWLVGLVSASAVARFALASVVSR